MINLSNTNHPQVDGKIKWINQVLKDMLRAYVNKFQSKWED